MTKLYLAGPLFTLARIAPAGVYWNVRNQLIVPFPGPVEHPLVFPRVAMQLTFEVSPN